MSQPSPQLACIVISYRGQPSVVDAVRSLVVQGGPTEIVVVNSGGNNPAEALRRANLNVRIIHREERLFAGGARNLGIQATTAPFVAFLAADCLAEPGWVQGRIERHQAGALAVSSAVTNAHPHNVFAWTAHVMVHARRMPGIPAGLQADYGISYARALFDRFGLFREELRTAEDAEFNQRFGGEIPVVWASEVRSAHETPTSFAELMRDQFARGRRRALSHVQFQMRMPGLAAVYASLNIVRYFRLAWAATQGRERAYVAGAAVVALPAWLAYNAGALLGSRQPSEPSAEASG